MDPRRETDGEAVIGDDGGGGGDGSEEEGPVPMVPVVSHFLPQRFIRVWLHFATSHLIRPVELCRRVK